MIRKLTTTITILCAFITLLAQDAPSAPLPENETFRAHRVVTFRPTSGHLKLDHQPIEQIVRSMRQKQSLPVNTSVTIHHQQYLAQNKVVINKNDSTVFIFSRGIEMRPCAARAALLYEHYCIPAHCPVIGFDYDDSRKHFSFGQDEDIALLKEIYDTVLQQNPSAKIVIVGNCNGAKVALELAAQKPKNLKGLVLLTPFISAPPLFKRITQSYLLGVPFSAYLTRKFFDQFTAYDPKKDDLITRLDQIDRRIPIFIGQRMDDKVVPDSEVEKLAHLLGKQGNPVDGLIVYDPSKSHNNLIYNKKIQYRINRFLKQHCLPYNVHALSNAPQEITG